MKKICDLMKNITDKELLRSLYLTQLLLIVISIVLGFFLFDHFTEFVALFKWDIK